MAIVTVEVTQKDIDEGIPKDCARCPVATALLREFPAVDSIEVSAYEAYFYRRRGRRKQASYMGHVDMPSSVTAFIGRFDEDDFNPPSPFTFAVDVPDKFLVGAAKS